MPAGRNVASVGLMNTKSKQHHPLIKALDDVIAAARAAELNETAALLKIARLDLLMRLHGIRANELELLSFALARGAYAEPPPRRPRTTSRKKPRAKLN
jgi:hypothetical protein